MKIIKTILNEIDDWYYVMSPLLILFVIKICVVLMYKTNLHKEVNCCLFLSIILVSFILCYGAFFNRLFYETK